MKILMLIHFVPYPPHGGSLQRSFNLLREVSKENTVHLLALNQKALLPDDKSINESVKALKRYCKYIRVFKIPADYNKLKWYIYLIFNLFSKKPFTCWWFYSREMAEEIKSLTRKEKYDLVHFDTIDLARFARYTGNIPGVMNHHNIESSLLLRRAKNEKNILAKIYLHIQARKLRKFEKRVIGDYSANLTVSDNDKKTLSEIDPNARAEIVPNGTDTGYFKPGDKITGTELIYVGGLNWYPNRDAMDYFCGEIYPLIKKEFPEIKLNIVGQSPPEDLVKISQSDPSVILHGFVDDIRTLVASSSVYVVPIRVGGGTRLKILDAFACGKALVSTSIGCEGIEVTPEENILIGDSAERFASQVVRILKDNELRISLGKNARRLAEEKYSWEIIGGKLNEIYKSVSG